MPINEPVLVDTSAFLSLMNPHDAEHEACSKVVEVLPLGKAYTCWPVVTEGVYLLRQRPADVKHFLNTIYRRQFELLNLTHTDVLDMHAVMEKFHDQEIDLADAALVHLAERENINTVFTLDRRHFRLLSRASGRHFRLLPDDFDG